MPFQRSVRRSPRPNSVGPPLDLDASPGRLADPRFRARDQCILVAPGVWLSSTKGPSDFAFYHTEGVIHRLTQIFGRSEAPIETILLATGLPGLAWMIRRQQTGGAALLGFCAAGLLWGYLAGGLRALDFLQPGRHTYALYTGLALSGAAGLEQLVRRLRDSGSGHGPLPSMGDLRGGFDRVEDGRCSLGRINRLAGIGR